MSINKRVFTLILSGLLASTSFSTLAASTDDNQTDKIKLYTVYGGAMLPINGTMDISMLINNELVVAKNNIGTTTWNSYVEVDKQYEFKEISAARFNWITQGKSYLCVADDLPLFVQGGDINTATSIHFMCK